MRTYVRTSRRTGVAFNTPLLWLLILTFPLGLIALTVWALCSDRFTLGAKLMIIALVFVFLCWVWS